MNALDNNRWTRSWNAIRKELGRSRSPLWVVYCLLVLYALPLVLLAAAYLDSDSFTRDSLISQLTAAVVELYATDVRETLGIFVVPFLMAYAATGAAQEKLIAPASLYLFMTLCLLFVLAIFVHFIANERLGEMVAQTEMSQDEVRSFREAFLGMSAAYIKEILVYVSFLLGITQVKSQRGQ